MLSQLMGVLAKRALFDVPAFTFVWLQLASAIVFMLAYVLFTRRDVLSFELTSRGWAAVVFVGVVNFGLCRLFIMMGIERLPMNTFVFVLSFITLATLGISVVFLGERPGRIQLLGVVLAILGARLFFREIPAPSETIGLVYAGVVVLGLAACNNVTRWLMSSRAAPIDPRAFSVLGLLIGGLPLVLAGVWTEGIPDVGGVGNAAIIVANGVIGIAMAQTVFNSVLRTLRSYEASVLMSSGLVWTALLSIPILGEWLEARQVFAIGVLMIGVVLSQRRAVEGGEQRAPGSSATE